MIRFLKFVCILIMITSGALADTDGNLELSKKNKQVQDCFEPLNRASFALNQGLDKALFKPIAKSYRQLPPSLRKGTGNVINNLSNLVTIPNNILLFSFKYLVT